MKHFKFSKPRSVSSDSDTRSLRTRCASEIFNYSPLSLVKDIYLCPEIPEFTLYMDTSEIVILSLCHFNQMHRKLIQIILYCYSRIPSDRSITCDSNDPFEDWLF